jgi:HTH-type transcriptional regulator, competence development regulator
MPKTLSEVLRDARVKKKGWSLRKAESETGIHNAHLSQIETGNIAQPSTALLWSLAEAYDLDYTLLLRLAGHTTKDASVGARRSLAGAALHALDDLTPQEQREVLDYMATLRRQRSKE